MLPANLCRLPSEVVRPVHPSGVGRGYKIVACSAARSTRLRPIQYATVIRAVAAFSPAGRLSILSDRARRVLECAFQFGAKSVCAYQDSEYEQRSQEVETVQLVHWSLPE